jgi:hypothetical protein
MELGEDSTAVGRAVADDFEDEELHRCQDVVLDFIRTFVPLSIYSVRALDSVL